MIRVDDSQPYDPLLFGVDRTSGIVGLQMLSRGSLEEPTRMRIYRRSEGTRTVEINDEPFYPFFILSDIRLLEGFPRHLFRFQHLNGAGFYRNLVVFERWGDFWDAFRHLDSTAPENQSRGHHTYYVSSPEQQYLMQTGRTLFKDLSFDDIHRLQLDIETYSNHNFSNPRRPEDRILLIALRDNRNWSHVVDGRILDEAEMLRKMIRIIRERDPDVIEGHNILGFDFPYILERARRSGVDIAIGRDGSAPRTFSTSIRFAERTVDYVAVEVAGRHVIDTYLQVLAFDVVKRDMPGYGLKSAAKYFGVAAENRTYLRGSEISEVWRTDPDRLVRYALDDVEETEALARRLSGSSFYLTQMVPIPFGQAARTGPAAKIEALFVREYMRRRAALPSPKRGTQTIGGYTDLFLTGIAGPIVYADVESLYPSIMLHWDVVPEADHQKLFPQLLSQLTELRLRTKRRMHAVEDDSERGELDARQSSYKVLINSFYGMLGFSRALFNDYSEADRVARHGQDLLRSVIRHISTEGGRVIEVDTDGVFFTPPPKVQDEDAEVLFISRLNNEMPNAIRIGLEGRYRKMLSYKMKNYALLGYDGALKFKGSSLISRSIERFGRRFVREAIRRLLDEDISGLHDLYLQTRDYIAEHKWSDVHEFSRTETIKDRIEKYRHDVDIGRRTKAAAYEVAIQRSERSGRRIRKGDRISYYVTGQAPDVTTFVNCKAADEWNPANPDENSAYYLRRLDDFASKFEPFFKPNEFRLIFSPEDLFGFSADGIQILSHERPVDLSEKASSPM